MTAFSAPVSDVFDTLVHMVGFPALMRQTESLDEEMLRAVLEGAGQMTTEVIAPTNRDGDQHGAILEHGKVTTPDSFKGAYKALCEGGWLSLAAPVAHGGQGLPRVLEVATMEMVQAANMAFGLCPVLSLGAIEALVQHGTDEQKRTYLPKLIAGEWTGTMNLTEPQAGSDVGALTTRAESQDQGQDEGQYRLYGNKIYITWGEHDLTDNIVHMVLARLPDAPAGSKGVSLFVAAKTLVNRDGSLGMRNDVRATSLEHKMGIHGSPTCVMAYGDNEGAEAQLVGQPNRGMAHMFTMMNAARIHVGAQGIGIAERAYQRALHYAQERKQGKAVWGRTVPAPIIDHPDVRRMLATSRAKILAGRAIVYAASVAGDMALTATSDEDRHTWKAREDLLVPIAKAWGTDLGVEVTSDALQVHGGMGYIEETGAAQHYRDARIAPIYEGTNAIQANDLVGRKLMQDDGRAAFALIDDATQAYGRAQARKALQMAGELGLEACDALHQATRWMVRQQASADALAGATSYLKLMGDVAGGMYLMRAALAKPDVYATLMNIYAQYVLTRAGGHAIASMMGAGHLQAVNLTA